MGVFRFDLLAKLGYFIDIAALKTILSFQFVFEFVCKRTLSSLQKLNLENCIVYSILKPRLRYDIYPARGRKPCVPSGRKIRQLLRYDIYPARGRKRSLQPT